MQFVEKNGRTVTGIEQLGSANPDQDLAVLLAAAKERLLPIQDTIDSVSSKRLQPWTMSLTGPLRNYVWKQEPTCGSRNR